MIEFWDDPLKDPPQQESQFTEVLPEWYDVIALGIDPTRGVVYEQSVQMMKDITGVDENDGMQDYTFFGIPAVSASPNIFEDFE